MNTLFVAGNAFYSRLNQSVKHLPFALAQCVDHVDIVGYVNFYNSDPAPAWQRVRAGMRNLRRDRVRVEQHGNTRIIAARRLHLPQPIDMLFQSLWMWLNLRSTLDTTYSTAIITAPDNAPLAAVLHRSGRIKRLVYYDADYYPGYVARRWAHIAKCQETWFMRHADAVASVSRPLAELRYQQGAHHVVIVPNGMDFERFHQANARRSHHHPPTLIYAGTLDHRWGVDLGIRVLPRLQDRWPEIRYLVVGDGPALADLCALAADLNVTERVTFAGRVPYETLPDWLAQADLGLATSYANAFRQYACPMKIVEYMAAGLPVICSGGGEAALMAAESCAGIHIEADLDTLANMILTLLDAPDLIAAMRGAGIAYAREHSWQHSGQKLAGVVRGITI